MAEDAFLYEFDFLGSKQNSESKASDKRRLQKKDASDGRFRTPKSTENREIETICCNDDEIVAQGSSLEALKAKFSKVKKLIKKGLVDEVETTLKDLSHDGVVQGSETKQRKMLKSLKKKLTQGCVNSDKIEKYYKRICKRWNMEDSLQDNQVKPTSTAAQVTSSDDLLMEDPFEADAFMPSSPPVEKLKSEKKRKVRSSTRKSKRKSRLSRSPKSAQKKGSEWKISNSSLAKMNVPREAFEQSCRLLNLDLKCSQLVWVDLTIFKKYNSYGYGWPALELKSVDGLNNKELKYVFDKKNPLWPTPANERLIVLLFWNFQSETKNIQAVPASAVNSFCNADKVYKKYMSRTNSSAKFWQKKMKHCTYKQWFMEAVRSLNAKNRMIENAQAELDRKAGTSATPQAVPDESSQDESSSEDEAVHEKIIETFEDKVLTAGDIVKYIDRTQPAYSRIQTSKVIEVRGTTHPHPIRVASNFPLGPKTSICRKINDTQFGHWRPIIEFKLVKGTVDEDDDSLAVAKKFSEKLAELRGSHKSFGSMVHFKSFASGTGEKRKRTVVKRDKDGPQKKFKSCGVGSSSKEDEAIIVSDEDSQGCAGTCLDVEKPNQKKRTPKNDDSGDFDNVEEKAESGRGLCKQSNADLDSSDSGSSSPIIEIEEIEPSEPPSNSSKRKRTYPMRKEELPVLGRLKVHPPDNETAAVQ